MRLAFEERGDVTVVRVQEAKLTYPVLLPFYSEVRQRVESGATRLVVDFAAVSYLDSTAISCLMELNGLVRRSGGSLRFSALPPRLEKLIAMAGVDKVVPLHRDADEAVAAFSSPAGDP